MSRITLVGFALALISAWSAVDASVMLLGPAKVIETVDGYEPRFLRSDSGVAVWSEQPNSASYKILCWDSLTGQLRTLRSSNQPVGSPDA